MNLKTEPALFRAENKHFGIGESTTEMGVVSQTLYRQTGEVPVPLFLHKRSNCHNLFLPFWAAQLCFAGNSIVLICQTELNATRLVRTHRIPHNLQGIIPTVGSPERVLYKKQVVQCDRTENKIQLQETKILYRLSTMRRRLEKISQTSRRQRLWSYHQILQ